MPNNDIINHPEHYTQGKIETLDYIYDSLSVDEFVGYIKGNVIKYLAREAMKGGLKDLKKAQFYLNYMIKKLDELETEVFGNEE